MMTLLYGVAALAVALVAVAALRGREPGRVAKRMKLAGGVVALGGGGAPAVRGRFDMALLLGGVGAWLLGWSGLRLPGFGSARRRARARCRACARP